jgi:hypothetical protein
MVPDVQAEIRTRRANLWTETLVQSTLDVRDQVLHPYVTAGKLILAFRLPWMQLNAWLRLSERDLVEC